MKSSLLKLGLVLSISALATLQVFADDAKPALKAPTAKNANLREANDWTLEIGSGYIFSDVRTDLPGYELIPTSLTASIQVDEVGLDQFASGYFRGYTEFFFKGFGMAVVHGTESRFVGLSLGPRYNFVQPGWKFVPFIDGNVGFAFTDSRGVNNAKGQIGQGQDFAFNFGITGGTVYNINDDYFLRFSALYTHFSNAGLSEPGRKNRALDGAGAEISFGCRF